MLTPFTMTGGSSSPSDDLPSRVLIGFAGIALVVLVCVILDHRAMLAVLIFFYLSGLTVVLRAMCAPGDPT